MNQHAAPPQGVPTLTEVVQWPEGDAPWSVASAVDAEVEAASWADVAVPPAAAQAAPPALPVVAPAPWPSEEQLTQAILVDVQRQIDLMLDYRMRELLAPLLARATDSLIRDTRHELASTLRDIVARAVAQEISRHRSR